MSTYDLASHGLRIKRPWGGPPTRTRLSTGATAIVAVACAFPLCGSAMASASPMWEVNGKQVQASVTVAAKGTFRVTHNPPAILGKGSFTAECGSSGEQSVGPGGEGEIKTRLFSTCKVVSSTNPYCTTATTIEIKATKLPWHTQLVTLEGSSRNDITTVSGSGEPGIELTCGADKAAASSNTSTALQNATGGVDETFDSHSAGFSGWTDGGSGGTLEGTVLLESPSSGALGVEPVGEWLDKGSPLASSLEANSSGSLQLGVSFEAIAGGGYAEVGCTESGKGTVNPHGESEVTSMSLTGCKVIREVGSPLCEVGAGAVVRAFELPWHTVLYTNRAGATREYGARTYEIQCHEMTAFGSGETSAALETTGEGVNQLFDERSELLGGGGVANSVTMKGNELLKVPGLEYRAGH